MSQVVQDPLEQARDAARRNAWDDAYALLKEADAESPLSGADLELLGHASMWTGRLTAATDAFERAYARFLEEGDKVKAAGTALMLAAEYNNKLQRAVAMGWHQRAARMLASLPESPAHGFLELQRSQMESGRGNLDGALEHIELAHEIAARVGDDDLLAQATLREGVALVKLGRVDEGLALIDEVSASAVAGGLEPFTTAIIYCNTIGACRDLADYSRAAEWTETAMRWCERNSIGGFPGMCRVNKAEIMGLRGAWAEAGKELVRATEELADFNPRVAGEAFHEIGEIRLRAGDLAAAEEAFGRALELGRDPQPGISLLRLAQGRLEAAASSMKRALEDETRSQLDRARLLPAHVEISLAAGDVEAARLAVATLEEIGRNYRISDAPTPALEASIQTAWGAVRLAEGDSSAAVACLRRALSLWREIDAPYEAARTRLTLGQAYLEAGDEQGAQEEMVAARGAFERLGATRDARRADELISGRSTKTFVFTDIVASTKLADALGGDRWKKVLARHDETLRTAFARNGGEIVKHTGDGFFAAFDSPGEAVAAAIEIQRALAEQGIAPEVRIGLHTASASASDGDYSGLGVNAAQRVSAVAAAGEIVATKESLESVDVRYADPRVVDDLKGLEGTPFEVVSIDWR
jgi:class 3 adenylate cyclase